ncbi:MAG: N-acyl-D-aspartate/D-glutamate deacylase [Gammaproteobacteria bacterium]|jgi:N-acyl-D-aspartate/D-glutamate deacylase
MHDLIIKNGTVIDGTGTPGVRADVAVSGEHVCALGTNLGPAQRTIDATDQLVMPGWVDVHTHYDGQATWDPYLTPSSWHGVTTAVFGNCGVGFAPMRPGTQDYLINLMEGVEDIPGSVLAEGMDFNWESFPDYLDVLESMPRALNVGAQVPHGALRFYVMGARGADHTQIPTANEINQMGRLLEEALNAGALGFTTSRTVKHKAADGSAAPSLSASDPELAGLAQAMRRAGSGVFECNSDLGPGEFAALRSFAEASGRPLSVLLLQIDANPGLWRETLDDIRAANAAGLSVNGQVGCRPIGILMGLETSVHPFLTHPAWRELADLSPAQRVAAVRDDPERRRRLVDERPHDTHTAWMRDALGKSYELGFPANYEPDPAQNIAARAAAGGQNPWSFVLDLMLKDEGRALLLYPFENYAHGNLDVVQDMLADEHTICGLGDAGAHVATICDASYPTFLLSHWGRDRSRGPGFPIEHLVNKQTYKTAQAYQLFDRGVLAPGFRADINIVDFDQLQVTQPELAYDLPAGGKRFIQRARGYSHTFVGGTEVACNGEHTGALPGRLVRGTQNSPGHSRGHSPKRTP